MADDDRKTTPTVGFRVPGRLWAAYGRVCDRLGTGRAEDLIDLMAQRVREYGDDADRADLEAAEQELAERRSRKGGRPPKR
jgi:hypothetical protein